MTDTNCGAVRQVRKTLYDSATESCHTCDTKAEETAEDGPTTWAEEPQEQEFSHNEDCEDGYPRLIIIDSPVEDPRYRRISSTSWGF